MAAFRKPVLLGLRDTAVRGRPTGLGAWTASKLGGVPDALPGVAAPGPQCARCAQPLALVVQVYCPLEGSPFHRLLHVFACARPGCGDGGTSSWKVFRSQCLQVREREAPGAQKQANGLAAENWCEGADDWGGDSEDAPPPPLTADLGNSSNGANGDWTAQLQALRLQDSGLGAADPGPLGEGSPALPSVVPQFQPFYICVADEDDYGDSVGLDHVQRLLQDYQQREGIRVEELLAQSSNDGDEKYEKTQMNSGDQIFHKFMKRIAVCQEQILRYSWSGEPLFLTCPTSEISEVAACGSCGGRRTFEFQLMPALVSMLSSPDLGLSVEFGTVLVYTCEKSCWPADHETPMEEVCVTQQDPDELLFR